MASAAGWLRRPVLRGGGPWFTNHPRTALAVAGVMFALVFALRLAFSNPLDAISMLYLFPIALVGMTKGRWGGVVAGLVAVGLVALWVLVTSTPLNPVGWISRALPMILMGLLIGDARTRLDRAASERASHQLAVQRRREAVEINDSLVQGMSAAKWAIEAGRVEAGLRSLGETVELGHRLVSDLIRDAEADGTVRFLARGDGPWLPGTDPGGENRAEGTKVLPVDDARP